MPEEAHDDVLAALYDLVAAIHANRDMEQVILERAKAIRAARQAGLP